MILFTEEISKQRLVERAANYQDLLVSQAADSSVKKQHWAEITKHLA